MVNYIEKEVSRRKSDAGRQVAIHDCEGDWRGTMDTRQLMNGIGRKLLSIDFLLDDLFEVIPENDGWTWTALVPFRVAVREAMDRWAVVIGEE